MPKRKIIKKARLEEARKVAAIMTQLLHDPETRFKDQKSLEDFGDFVFFTQLRDTPPRQGFLVSTKHLLGNSAVLPCIRVKLFANWNGSVFTSGGNLQVTAGLIRQNMLRRNEVRLTTERKWPRLLWNRNRKFTESQFFPAPELPIPIKNDLFSKWWFCGEEAYREGTWKSINARESEQQYLAIMLLHCYWEREGAKPKSRAADLLSLQLIVLKDVEGNAHNLMSRAGVRFPKPFKFKGSVKASMGKQA